MEEKQETVHEIVFVIEGCNHLNIVSLLRVSLMQVMVVLNKLFKLFASLKYEGIMSSTGDAVQRIKLSFIQNMNSKFLFFCVISGVMFILVLD